MNYKVMVVDDEEEIRNVIKQVLGRSGFTVFCAENGKEALEILKKEKDIHLFFLDLQLPRMNGVELCFEIRKKDPLGFICAITGYASIYGLIQCRKAGFDDYFVKPFDITTLINVAYFAFDKLKRWEEYK